MPKIVIIGGGSYTWGPTLMRDIFATPELAGSTLILHDIVQDRLDRVDALGQKMIHDFNLNFHLEKTRSLEEALLGFVHSLSVDAEPSRAAKEPSR